MRMIEPTSADIGRTVIYRPHPNMPPEYGVITSFNKRFVFVRHGFDDIATPTHRKNLHWPVTTATGATGVP